VTPYDLETKKERVEKGSLVFWLCEYPFFFKLVEIYENRGHVCFPEFTFWETIFQTFLCLFAIRKVGQRKTLSGQRKTLSSQWKHFPVNGKHFPVKKKFGLVSRKVSSLLAVFVFRKVIFGKPLSKLSCVCLPLEKLVNGKHFPVKGKFDLVFRKVFSLKIWAENTFRKL
jgi:hypothetical protein